MIQISDKRIATS